MNEKYDLTTGPITKRLVQFALPYLLAAFMQTFYGLVDLFVVGLYNDSSTTTAVSVGSQVMHMLTTIIIGFAMGTTVQIAKSIGAKDADDAGKVAGNSFTLFGLIAAVSTIVLLLLVGSVTNLMMTPIEAKEQTVTYLLVCFAGIPFIISYNLIAGIFRGAGDSKRPMIFVAAACIVNIVLDFVLIGGFGLGALGAALGTICGQAVSVLAAVLFLRKMDLGFHISKDDLRPDGKVLKRILGVGAPVAVQEGLIQTAFIVITIIANSRGLIFAAGVGIVEKIISFLFLVPSSFLAAISAFSAQNMGAELPERAKKGLFAGIGIAVSWGLFCFLYNQFLPGTLVGLFTRDTSVLNAGCDYLRSYSFDVMAAGISFCFSGYFCGIQKSILSFLHNILSVALVRIPAAYFCSIWWPNSLYPMGWGIAFGSLFSAILCTCFYLVIERRQNRHNVR